MIFGGVCDLPLSSMDSVLEQARLKYEELERTKTAAAELLAAVPNTVSCQPLSVELSGCGGEAAGWHVGFDCASSAAVLPTTAGAVAAATTLRHR